MTRSNKFLSLMFSTLVAGCVFAAQGAPEPVSTDPCEVFPSRDGEPGDRGAALSGNPDEAMDLYLYYRNRSDVPGMLKWARIAAENGSTAANYEYGNMLWSQSDPESKLRAKFHLRLAARNGSTNAATLLSLIEPAEADKK